MDLDRGGDIESANPTGSFESGDMLLGVGSAEPGVRDPLVVVASEISREWV